MPWHQYLYSPSLLLPYDDQGLVGCIKRLIKDDMFLNLPPLFLSFLLFLEFLIGLGFASLFIDPKLLVLMLWWGKIKKMNFFLAHAISFFLIWKFFFLFTEQSWLSQYMNGLFLIYDILLIFTIMFSTD